MRVPDDRAPDVMTLTESAARAAAAGEWNVVEVCYHQRRTALDANAPSSADAARMLELDREVVERLRLAQAGVRALLRDASQVRQRVHEFHQWQVGQAGEPSLLRKHL